MNIVSAYAIFCEDIREEKVGGHTIVGAMRDTLRVPGFPGQLPKFGIYARISVAVGTDISPIDIYMVNNSDSGFLIGHLNKDMIHESFESAKLNGSPTAGIIASIIAAPFQVNRPNHTSIEIECDGKRTVIGGLNFMEMEPIPG